MDKDASISSDSSSKNTEDKRLWLGNLDPRINEYQLLKLVQKYGTIEKFDLLFHRTGPLAGQPRGYAFVTFSKREEATEAKERLHNLLVGTRRMTVTWAYSITDEASANIKPERSVPEIPALAGAGKTSAKPSRLTQIQAIEAKLKMMENRSSTEFEINKTVADEVPVIAQYRQKITNEVVQQRQVRKQRRDNIRPYRGVRRR